VFQKNVCIVLNVFAVRANSKFQLVRAAAFSAFHVTFIKIINVDENNKTRLFKNFGKRCKRLLHLCDQPFTQQIKT